MKHVSRSPAWGLVALLLALFLAYDLGAGEARSDDWAALSPTAAQQGLLLAGQVLRIQYIPDPNDIVNLVEGTPYTVPAGMVLIITDWVVTRPATLTSDNTWFMDPRVRADGIDIWGGGYSASARITGSSQSTSGGGVLAMSMASGIRADSGQSVTLHANANYVGPVMFASGYLAKAQ